MKAIVEGQEAVTTAPRRQVQSKKPIEQDTTEDAYLQINKTSFQQNFKVLVGHYKNEGPEARI